jgi:hypothetical protein
MKAKKVYEFRQGGNPYDIMGLGSLKSARHGDKFTVVKDIHYIHDNDSGSYPYNDFDGYTLDPILPDIDYLRIEQRFWIGDTVTYWVENKKEQKIYLVAPWAGNSKMTIPIEWAIENASAFNRIL